MKLTLDDLLLEGKRLAKPSVVVMKQTNPTEPICGYWGGETPKGISAEDSHLCTVDLSIAPTPRKGILTICFETEDCTKTRLRLEPGGLPAPTAGATLMTFKQQLSLPPIEAICHFGGGHIQEWLASNKYDRAHFGLHGGFQDKPLVYAYEEKYCADDMLFSFEAYLVVGGWHRRWVDTTWEDYLSQTHVLTTACGCPDPYREVWELQGELQACTRFL